jgi:hypothetical protein
VKLEFFQKQIRRGMRRYKKATGLVPEIYEITEHEDDSEFLTITFSQSVARLPGLYSAKAPHLLYSFSMLCEKATLPNRFEWNGLKKWDEKQLADVKPGEPWPYAVLDNKFNKNKITMRLKGDKYYCDNGGWDVKFKIEGNKIFADPDYNEVMHLAGSEFTGITRSEWIKENG